MNIAEIKARISEAEQQVADRVAAEDMEGAYKAEGRLSEMRDELGRAIDAMEAENEALKAAPVADAVAPRTACAQAFGDETDFNGVEPGMRGAAVVNAAWTTDNPVSTDTNLPSIVLPAMNFLDTLPKGTADGDEKYFVPGTPSLAAGEWTIGTTKPESAIDWDERTAHLATIAHWIPIHKQMAKRYGTLEERTRELIENGLRFAADNAAIMGNSNNGIVGIFNTQGVQTYTAAQGENMYDVIVKMASQVRTASGYAPNYVAMHPETITALALMKDGNENYMFPNIKAGGTIAGLTIVEDANLVIEGAESNTLAAIVYYNGGAVFKTAGEFELAIGTVADQFTKNMYTLLGEVDALLRVDNPAAFCVCNAMPA